MPSGIPGSISGIVSNLDPAAGGFDTCDTPPIYPNFGCIPVVTMGATVTGTLVIGGTFTATGFGFPTVPKFVATAFTYAAQPTPTPVATASAIVTIQRHR